MALCVLDLVEILAIDSLISTRLNFQLYQFRMSVYYIDSYKLHLLKLRYMAVLRFHIPA
jgi:hypothetical protein